MLKLLRRLVAGLSLSLAAASPASAATPRVPPTARPALWAVSDADTTVYLFGTIHLLPEHYQWRSSQLEQAVQGSEELVVETLVDTKDPTKIMGALTSLAFSPGLPPLADRVPPDKRGDLANAIKMSGFAPQALDKMETWAAAFLLLGNQFRNIGLKGGEGVEMGLRTSFSGAGKPIGELESNVEQLAFFDRLPEQAQRALLLGSISTPHDMSKDFAAMLAAWARGDVKAIARTFAHDLDSSPELKQALITQRNVNWSRWIEQRMTVPGSVMVAIGAGHLAGKGSVITMLEQAGYKVKRVQ